MKRNLAALTTLVALGLTPIAAAADTGPGGEAASPNPGRTAMHATQMMSGDCINLQDCVATADHTRGRMHAVMQHADAAAMDALMKKANPVAMRALMNSGRDNAAGGRR